jgi:hypothetical protein
MNNPSTVNLLGINRDNHTLTAKFLCQIIDQLWVFTAEELIETLSILKQDLHIGGRNSATYRKWNINCSHLRTKSTKVFLLSSVAEISKNTNSSAPAE